MHQSTKAMGAAGQGWASSLSPSSTWYTQGTGLLCPGSDHGDPTFPQPPQDDRSNSFPEASEDSNTCLSPPAP